MTRKSSVPWEISVTVKHLFAKVYNIDSEILEAEQKVYASFRRMRVGLGYNCLIESSPVCVRLPIVR